MNTPIMTAGHVETMEELHDAIRRFVTNGKVVSLEEYRMLRLAEQAMDEATLLDYAFRLLACGIRANGMAGQRYGQLYREMETFRAAMVARQNGDAA